MKEQVLLITSLSTWKNWLQLLRESKPERYEPFRWSVSHAKMNIDIKMDEVRLLWNNLEWRADEYNPLTHCIARFFPITHPRDYLVVYTEPDGGLKVEGQYVPKKFGYGSKTQIVLTDI